MKTSKQPQFLNQASKSYGGELFKTRRGRSQPRPLVTRGSMHLVLRSSKAKGSWSFKRPEHEQKIRELTDKFSKKNGIKIYSLANVGNHLHFHIKLSNRHTYKKFIRGLTSAIAMAISGTSRWNPAKDVNGKKAKFWDYRPFTRVVQGFRHFLNIRDYIQINQLEGLGLRKIEARLIFAKLQETG